MGASTGREGILDRNDFLSLPDVRLVRRRVYGVESNQMSEPTITPVTSAAAAAPAAPGKCARGSPSLLDKNMLTIKDWSIVVLGTAGLMAVIFLGISRRYQRVTLLTLWIAIGLMMISMGVICFIPSELPQRNSLVPPLKDPLVVLRSIFLLLLGSSTIYRAIRWGWFPEPPVRLPVEGRRK